MMEWAEELPPRTGTDGEASGSPRVIAMESLREGASPARPSLRPSDAMRHDLERLYDSHHEQLYLCALTVTRCPDLAEDALHDVFCRLLSRTDAPRDLRVYVFRSVRNAAIDILRKGGRTVELIEDFLFDPSPNPRRSAESAEFQRRVSEALVTLSPDERETIVQHLYAELTFREVAELREISINTVMSWYRRGLAKMRARLEE